MKLLEAFAGIGAWRKALIRQQIDFESVGYYEIDKYAIKSYSLLYNDTNCLGSIINAEPPKCDLFCYSPPCQSFSVAGKRGGLNDTRGTLFFDAAKVIEKAKPKWAIMENVKGLLSDDKGKTIYTMLSTLYLLGYNNYMQVLNAKDYGIPQNRERVFIVSIRKDVDTLTFGWPEKEELRVKLKDIIQKEYNKKYRVSKQGIEYIKNAAYREDREIIQYSDICKCLKAKGYTFCYNQDGIIRRMMPIEYMLLTGFDITDYNNIKDHISDTQIYKQSGNSIVVNVCEAIFKSLFKSDNKQRWFF